MNKQTIVSILLALTDLRNIFIRSKSTKYSENTSINTHQLRPPVTGKRGK